MAKSTTECRKGCPVFEDWQKMEAETAADAVIAMQAEIEELKAQLAEKGEYGYSQQTVDALTKERDELKGALKNVQATSIRLELERNEMEEIINLAIDGIDALLNMTDNTPTHEDFEAVKKTLETKPN